MTVSSTLEMKLRDRGASNAPADAASKLLHIDGFTSDEAEQRFGQLVHWAYGPGGARRRSPSTAGTTPSTPSPPGSPTAGSTRAAERRTSGTEQVDASTTTREERCLSGPW
jgi:hypothetical protein